MEFLLRQHSLQSILGMKDWAEVELDTRPEQFLCWLVRLATVRTGVSTGRGNIGWHLGFSRRREASGRCVALDSELPLGHYCYLAEDAFDCFAQVREWDQMPLFLPVQGRLAPGSSGADFLLATSSLVCSANFVHYGTTWASRRPRAVPYLNLGVLLSW